jgi:hypothetical protein
MTKSVWIVRWRAFEEERAGRQDALDRWGQLDARGVEAEVLELAAGGGERPAGLVGTPRFAAPHEADRAALPRARRCGGRGSSAPGALRGGAG